ncbi:MAG: type II secretion system protein F [Lachnospiraceae bacterium]|nr:type II secretion system protein F [Lachnospiraceae bacterium]
MAGYQAGGKGLKIDKSLLWQELIGKLPELLKVGIVFSLFAWLFYNNLFVIVFFLPFYKPVGKYLKKNGNRKKTEEGNMQFKDFLHSLSASMRAGYAVENAFYEAYQELAELYGKNAFIPKELARMLHQMKLNRPAEEVLEEFGKRSGLEDAKNFAGIFKAAKRSSGNLSTIMSNTAETIGKKLETQREIQVLVQEKRYEQKVMNLMPLAIILYLRLGNGEFMEILYTSLTGKVLMTICLLIYLVAYCMAEKIVNIKM